MNYPSEKRDFERIAINTAVTLSYNTPERTCEGLCYDLSKSGIGLEIDNVIPLGTECRVRIHDGRKNQFKFQALVEVKRIQERDDGRYMIGALILEKY